MRFESISDLYNFISKLSALTGLTAKLIDYKGDMKSKGLDKHIHEYPCYLELTPLNKGQLAFYSGANEIVPIYTIALINIESEVTRK